MTAPAPPPVDQPLVGPQHWPGSTARYRLDGTRDEPTLTVVVSVAHDHGLPGPGGAPQPAALLAAQQAEQYRLIGSQLDEPGLTVALLTTLDPERALPSADGLPSLQRFVKAVQVFTRAAAAAMAPSLTGIATLGELLESYGLLPEHLAAANADHPLNVMLAGGQPLAMRTGQIEPDTVPADASTLAQVAARLGITPERLLDDNRGLRLAAEPAVVLPGMVTLPIDTRIPYLTRAGDTLAELAGRFGTTARDLVAGNADVPGVLPAGVRVGVEVSAEASAETSSAAVTVGADTVAGDSFGSLHARLAEQAAGVTLEAVADVLDRLGVALAPDVLLSCPLAVLGSGRDGAGPLTATEVSAEHGCPPAAFAAANAAVLGLLQPGVRLRAGDRAVTTAERDTLHAVLARLATDGCIPSVAELIADHAEVALFRAGGRALLPPPPACVTACADQAPGLAAAAVPLVVTLRLERAKTAVASAERADTVVSPASRDALADACLTVLPTVRLATDARDELWAVSFGGDGIASVRIEPSAGGALGPRAFGLRPVYRQLADFDAWIRPVTDQGGLGTPVRQQFHQLDVEPWARSFLADVDRCLSLTDRLPDTARAQLAGVRRRLATAIAGGLAPLLAEPNSPAADDGQLRARAALAGIARSGLAPAYATVIAQYRAVAVSPYGRDGQPPAWLVGAVDVPDRPGLSLSGSRTELDRSDAWCVFAVTSADPTGAASLSISPRQVFAALELDSSHSGSPQSGSAEPVMLRFVRPLEGSYRPETVAGELPPAHLPLTVREHPGPPLVSAMTATPTFSGPGLPTLAEAAQWTASLRYTHPHAAQDVITVSWAEAAAPAAATVADTAPAEAGTALAEALAGYAAAAPALTELIGLTGIDAQSPDGLDAATVRAAAASLAELATEVAAAWARHWPDRDRPAAAEAAPAGQYRLRASYVPQPDGRRMLDRVVVRRASGEDAWPVISLESRDRQVPLTPGPVVAQTREYVAPEASAESTLTLRLEWPGLRGAPRPGTRISLAVERNAMSPAGEPISPAFLLVSPTRQVEVATPSLRWDQELPLTGAGIAEALQNAFDVLAGQQPAKEQPEAVRLSIEVGYAEPVGELQTVLPVLAIPELELTSESAGAIAAELTAWQLSAQPATGGGQWRVRLARLSGRRDEPPILAFDQLVLPVTS